MADYDASNPYAREAVANGVNDLWIADFLRRNPGDYHRIMAAASGDAGAFGGVARTTGGSSLVLSDLAPAYQVQVRPGTAAPSALAGLAGGSPIILLAVAAAAWFIYKRL